MIEIFLTTTQYSDHKMMLRFSICNCFGSAIFFYKEELQQNYIQNIIKFPIFRYYHFDNKIDFFILSCTTAPLPYTTPECCLSAHQIAAGQHTRVQLLSTLERRPSAYQSAAPRHTRAPPLSVPLSIPECRPSAYQSAAPQHTRAPPFSVPERHPQRTRAPPLSAPERCPSSYQSTTLSAPEHRPSVHQSTAPQRTRAPPLSAPERH